MTGTSRRPAARGRLAWLVVVAAVLGLGLAAGIQCAGGMAAAMPMTHVAHTVSIAAPCVSAADMAPIHRTGHTVSVDTGLPILACAPTAAVGEDGTAPTGLGGLLATCLAFLVAVLAVVAALRHATPVGVARIYRSARAAVIGSIQPRTPSLAQLCLLRT